MALRAFITSCCCLLIGDSSFPGLLPPLEKKVLLSQEDTGKIAKARSKCKTFFKINGEF